MREEFSQGTIITNIRTKKYPNIKCKGIVISARCDFAQNKIKYFHCISAMRLEEWIYEVLFWDIISEQKKNCFAQIKNYAQQAKLDFETIISLGPENAKKIFADYLSKEKECLKAKEICVKWEEIIRTEKEDLENDKKKELLIKYKANKSVTDKIKSLSNGVYPKFCLLPQCSFCESELGVEGLVVDLQDIHQYNISLVNDIKNNKYDYQLIKDTIMRSRIDKLFFFNDEDDFVIIEGMIRSPWIEHLLQHFSNSFIRIGIDNALPDKIETYCDSFLVEE